MEYFKLAAPLKPAILDLLLAKGGYRIQQAVFTTQNIEDEVGRNFEVFWARIVLKDFVAGKYVNKINKQCSKFSCTFFDGMVIDAEINELHALYRAAIDFEAPFSVQNALLGNDSINYFPSATWKVRDGDKLVAVGYFDLGNDSAAGILNFYHPDYKKYSLGKWLYFQSVIYTANSGRHFFYPGYIVPGYPKFDYKLNIGTEYVELWNWSELRWISYTEFASFLVRD